MISFTENSYKHIISFEGDSAKALIEDFHNAIDEIWNSVRNLANIQKSHSKVLKMSVGMCLMPISQCICGGCTKTQCESVLTVTHLKNSTLKEAATAQGWI